MLSQAKDFSRFQHILICEDHPLVQLGLKVTIEKLVPHLQSLQVASSGAEALTMSRLQTPDLAILDLGLPDMHGTSVIQNLKSLHPHLEILVITSCDTPAILAQVKNIGVAGIIQKASSGEELTKALQHIQSGNSRPYLDQDVRKLLLECENIQFTPREYEVLLEIITGQSNQEIADKLGCALTTVRFHRANIMAKAGVHNSTELAAWFSRKSPKT